MPSNWLILKGNIFPKHPFLHERGFNLYNCCTVTGSWRRIKESTSIESENKLKIKTVLKPLHYSLTRYEEVENRKGKKKYRQTSVTNLSTVSGAVFM